MCKMVEQVKWSLMCKMVEQVKETAAVFHWVELGRQGEGGLFVFFIWWSLMCKVVDEVRETLCFSLGGV